MSYLRRPPAPDATARLKEIVHRALQPVLERMDVSQEHKQMLVDRVIALRLGDSEANTNIRSPRLEGNRNASPRSDRPNQAGVVRPTSRQTPRPASSRTSRLPPRGYNHERMVEKQERQLRAAVLAGDRKGNVFNRYDGAVDMTEVLRCEDGEEKVKVFIFLKIFSFENLSPFIEVFSMRNP